MTIYAKMSKELRPVDMAFEYEQLEDKLQFVRDKVVTKNEAGETIREVGYYEGRRNEIKLEWLNGGGGSEYGNGATQEENYIWHASMPISLWQCREVYDAALRGLPKKTVEHLIFADYDLDANEGQLFDVVYNYGQAKGLYEVATELYEGAKAGDPRAVKMYLEVSGLLLVTEESKEESQRKKLMRISFDI